MIHQLVSIVVLLLSIAGISVSAGVQIKGKIECKAFNIDGSSFTKLCSIHDFALSFDSEFATYTLTYLNDSDSDMFNRGAAKSVFHFDGTNHYYLRYKHKNGIVDRATNVWHYGNIVPGGMLVPQTYIQEVGTILWSCLCSGKSLQLKEFPLPWAIPRSSPLAYGFSATNVLLGQGTGIPLAFKLVRRKALDLPDSEELSRPELNRPVKAATIASFDQELAERRERYAEGFIVAELSCGKSQLRGGGEYPQSFKFTIFHPAYGDQPRYVYEGQLTEVETAEQNPKLEILANLNVDDVRFRNFEGGNRLYLLTYPLKLGSPVPSTNDPALQASYQSALKFKRNAGDHWKRYTLLSVGGALTAGMGYLLFRTPRSR